jgi:protein-S-isoprenylcysteine O-methyltransferase Ste14
MAGALSDDARPKRIEMSSTVASALAVARRAGIDLAALRDSSVYDVLMRLPVLGYSLFLALFSVWGLLHQRHTAGSALAHAVNVTMRLSVIAYFVVLAASMLIRARPERQAHGFEPRISAMIGTFSILAVALLPRHDLTVTGQTISTLLLLGGNALAVLVLVQLRSSFSIMAEARRLVTSGVYRWVRHPLYLAEELAVIGIVLQFLSPWVALLLVVQIAFQLRRMHNEERVLSETFPEYADYKKNTAMLLPRLY